MFFGQGFSVPISLLKHLPPFEKLFPSSQSLPIEILSHLSRLLFHKLILIPTSGHFLLLRSTVFTLFIYLILVGYLSYAIRSLRTSRFRSSSLGCGEPSPALVSPGQVCQVHPPKHSLAIITQLQQAHTCVMPTHPFVTYYEARWNWCWRRYHTRNLVVRSRKQIVKGRFCKYKG